MNYDEINSNNPRDPFTLCQTFKKNSKDYGEPDITYQLAGCAEQRPTMPRISGIQVGNGQGLVGFRESELKHKEFERVFPEKYNKRYNNKTKQI